MDRSADGGMAPALQSCNHQSTDLANEDAEANQAGSPLPCRKVNGKAREVEAGDNYSQSTAREGSIDAADGGAPSIAFSEHIQESKRDTCVLTGLKEALPQNIMPSLQIGQGDSVIGHIADYNGWGNRKKSFIGGILQESNSLPASQPYVNKSALSKNGDVVDISESNCLISRCENGENKEMLESPAKCNGHLELKGSENSDISLTAPNGHAETVLAELVESVCDNADSESNKKSDSGTSLPIKLSGDLERLTPMNSISHIDEHSKICDSLETEPVLAMEVEHDCSKSATSPTCVDCGPVTPSTSENIEQLPDSGDSRCDDRVVPKHVFLDSGILPGALSGMSMSDNVTNTLQELAASLKGAAFPLHFDGVTKELVATDSNHTVNTDVEQRMPNDDSDSTTEQEARVSAKIDHVTHCAGMLEHRLGLLKRNLLMLRSKGVSGHVQKELTDVARCLPRQDWESRAVDVVDVDTNSPAEFWQRVLENAPQTWAKHTFRDHVECRDSVKMETDREDAASVRVSRSDSDRKGSVEIENSIIEPDPVKHFARLDSSSVPVAKFRQEMRSNAGVMKKELRYVQSCCDPDLTESSSDEDLDVAFEDRSRKMTKSSKGNPKPRITRYRKSFCRWVAERAEISRKWTWLQSRISSVEFDIRHQGELYSQLRANKGMVHLKPATTKNILDCNTDSHNAAEASASNNVKTQSCSPQSPYSVNHMLHNVNHQASRLMDKLSPVSGGCPSPLQEDMETSEPSAPEVVAAHGSAVPTSEASDACARTTPLDLTAFKTRRLVRLREMAFKLDKCLNPPTVPNDSSIACLGRRSCGLPRNESFSSLVLKAAAHDHSYHAAISSLQDLPLSVSIRAVMKSKHNWSKKSTPGRKRRKWEKNKLKRQSRKKLLHGLSHGNHLEEPVEGKRRKLTSQLSEPSSRKKTFSSLDSEINFQACGGLNYHQSSLGSCSGASTPTPEILNQTHLKRKKVAEQAFDINNVFIPHGLNSSRIEKLVYKEIQTPSWKILEIPDTPEKVDGEDSTEDTSDAVFQIRHDNYEIAEKKKYIAYMHWSISRRASRGSRMSNIRDPSSQPVSPTAAPDHDDPHPTSPAANFTRRLSTDRGTSEHQYVSPPHEISQTRRDTVDTSNAVCTSPVTMVQSEPPSRRSSHDNAVPRTTTVGPDRLYDSHFEGWQTRSFPLIEDDLVLLEDVELAKTKVPGYSEGQEQARYSLRPHAFERALSEYARSAERDLAKIAGRRRTDSRASLASFDDPGRHSDASNASASSSRRKKRALHGAPAPSGQRHGAVDAKGATKRRAASRLSKHKYIHVRLSETDDTSSDSDMDDSSDDSVISSDDAGHLVDDFADPEWPAPRYRDRR